MNTQTSQPSASSIQHEWRDNPRWSGIQRPYSAEDVLRLRGTIHIVATRVARSSAAPVSGPDVPIPVSISHVAVQNRPTAQSSGVPREDLSCGA